MLVSGGLTGPWGTTVDGGLRMGMSSWEVDGITGSTGAAIAELVEVGVGSDGTGGVSDMAIFGGMDGNCKRPVVAASSGLPWFASISCVKLAGAGVDMGSSASAPAGLTGGSCVRVRAGSGTNGTGESEKDLAGGA